MEAVAGYYDGKSIQFLERVPIRKNQRVIVTVMDEFVEDKVVAGNGVSNNKRAAFERLDAWRKNNEDVLLSKQEIQFDSPNKVNATGKEAI